MGGEGVKSLDLLHTTTGKQLIRDHIKYIDKLKIRCDNTISERNIGLGHQMCYASYKNGFIIRASGKVEKCTVALDKPQNEVGYLDINGNLNVYCEKNKEWSERAMHNKCYSCNKVFSCLNKMCPYKSVMNRNYVCENYRNFGNEG